VLLGFGLAGAAANFAAGVTVRAHLRATLMGAGLLIACSTLRLAAVTGTRPLIIALVAVWGLGYGAVPVAAQSWMAQAMPANVEGGLALFVSALQGSLAAGSAVGGLVYDAEGPGGALIVAAVFAALGALTLLGRAGAAIGAAPALKLPFAAIPRPRPKGRNCHAKRGCDDRIRTA
jgi:predicted MFS family arabinose efflux permease